MLSEHDAQQPPVEAPEPIGCDGWGPSDGEHGEPINVRRSAAALDAAVMRPEHPCEQPPGACDSPASAPAEALSSADGSGSAMEVHTLPSMRLLLTHRTLLCSAPHRSIRCRVSTHILLRIQQNLCPPHVVLNMADHSSECA